MAALLIKMFGYDVAVVTGQLSRHGIVTAVKITPVTMVDMG
jgi:hypothetical protein